MWIEFTEDVFSVNKRTALEYPRPLLQFAKKRRVWKIFRPTSKCAIDIGVTPHNELWYQ